MIRFLRSAASPVATFLIANDARFAENTQRCGLYLNTPLSSEAATGGVKKETLAHVFSCEFCEISKNTFFTEQLWTTASVS